MISATIRDMPSSSVAVQTVSLAFARRVIWQIWRLVKMLQTEIKPIISGKNADTCGERRCFQQRR